jgi:hypothetical protein
MNHGCRQIVPPNRAIVGGGAVAHGDGALAVAHGDGATAARQLPAAGADTARRQETAAVGIG